MAKNNKNILDIVSGISSVLAKKHDGALDDKGERQDLGLRRDEETPLKDARWPRTMDGFSVNIVANKLVLTYHSQIHLSDVHSKKWEKDVRDYLDKAVKWIKKEYKNLTKSALSLTSEGEPVIKVETMSRIRSWVTAKQIYKIGSVDIEPDGSADREKSTEAIRKWLDQKSEAKPKNVSISAGDNEKKDD